MSEQARDAHGRFSRDDRLASLRANAGVNELFRGRGSLRVGVEYPAHHVAMNDRLRGIAPGSSEEADETTLPAPRSEGLDGGAGSPAEPVDTNAFMNATIRARAGKGPQDLGRCANGLPLRVE